MGKSLTLIRHAKSSWDDPQLDDFDRPLSRRGERELKETAPLLHRLKLPCELLLASPAQRTRATAALLAKALALPDERIAFDHAIFEADSETLLFRLQQADDAIDHLVLVGHNPGLTELANHLGPVVIDNIPTCGVVELHLPALRHWHELSPKSATLRRFLYPRLLGPRR